MSSVKSIGTTLVGCGAVAQRLYRKPLQQLERQGLVRVTALVDNQRPHAEALASFFPKATLHEDLSEAPRTTASEFEIDRLLGTARTRRAD